MGRFRFPVSSVSVTRPDAIVILGAQVFPSGGVSASLRRRIDHAIEVWRRHPEAVLIPSGGVGEAPISEAEAMRRIAIEAGVPEESIVLEDRSTSTFEHAAFVATLARGKGWQALTIVTDRYHTPRALFLFRRLGLTVSGDPVRGPGQGSRRRWLEGVVREIPAWGKNLVLVALGRHRRDGDE
jgi:uncharacterized SAM-binding protein YcdF (DUF218 family)